MSAISLIVPAIDDDRADVVVVGGARRGRPDLLLDLDVQRVHRRTVETQRRDPAVLLEPYELSHGPRA
jgi:hypothetical protein